MFKINALIFLVSCTFFISCSNTQKEDSLELNAEEIKVEIEFPAWIQEKLSDFPYLELDFEVKEKFFNDSVKNHQKFELSMEEVKLLSQNLNNDDETQANSYILNSYFTITKAKHAKKYAEYEASLDIGMMRDANCFSLGRFEVNDSVALIFWKIEYSSYEACPFFSGTHLFVTVVSKGKIFDCLQFAQQESVGDAPMHAYTIQTGKISKEGTINYHYECIVEEDEEEIEHPEYKKSFKLFDNVFIIQNDKKK